MRVFPQENDAAGGRVEQELDAIDARAVGAVDGLNRLRVSALHQRVGFRVDGLAGGKRCSGRCFGAGAGVVDTVAPA
jgi:hypothetical protein